MQGSPIEFSQIETLFTIVEQKSFSRAARVLGVRQPAVSQLVKRWEQRLGRALFQRRAGGVQLTHDGEALLIYARAVAKLTEEIVRHFHQPAAHVVLKLGIAEDFSRTALTHTLWLFSRAHPLFELSVTCGDSESLVRANEENRFDLLVMKRHHRLHSSELLWSEKLTWFGRSDLVLPVVDPVPLIVPPAHSTLRETILDCLRREGRSWRIPLETNSLASAEAAARAGLGLCAFPRSMELHGSTPLPERAALPDLPLVDFVLVRRPDLASDAVAAFAQVLAEAARLSFRAPT